MKRYLTALLLLTSLAGCANSSNQNQTILSSTPQEKLTNYYWQLQEAKDKQETPISVLFIQADKPIQIEFKKQSFNISNICNNINGIYFLKEKEILFESIAATKKMCDEKLIALDDEISKYLQKTVTYNIASDKEKTFLTLNTYQGNTLKFIGIPTPETRFNSDGEIIYLEIAPQKTPCHKSGLSKKECFQVRQIYYDDKGIKTQKTTPWQDLDQNIEGFQFQSGIRNILRVKKYPIANSSEKTSNFVYIFDMVIESENVQLKR